jgi:uncharacterized membrane protein YcfT
LESISEKENVSARNVLPNDTRKRMAWVDYARGMAIILVVYRHTMVGLERSGTDVPSFLFNIQEFLVNVRMPVFFVLSGIFLGRSLLKRSAGYLVSKKAKTLLYPYLLWTVILITVQIMLSDYTNSKRTVHDYLYIITQPRNLDHMWYLLALFNTSLVMILLMRRLVKSPAIHLGIALVLHYLHYWVGEYSLLSDLLYYYIFLAVGVHLSSLVQEYDNKGSFYIVRLLLLTSPFFIAGQLFWLNNINDNYVPDAPWYTLPFLAVILIACIMFYCVCRLLYNAGVAKWLNTVGKGSLYIYILHILIISSLRIFCQKVLGIYNVYALIALSLSLGIIIPVYIYKLSAKWPALGYLFSLEKQGKK